MPNVIAIERTNKDIRAAGRFGPVRYLFPADEQRPSIFETQDFIKSLNDKLDEIGFDYEKDYFLAVGQVIPLNLAFYTLANRYPSVHVLFFHAQIQEYVPRLLIT